MTRGFLIGWSLGWAAAVAALVTVALLSGAGVKPKRHRHHACIHILARRVVPEGLEDVQGFES